MRLGIVRGHVTLTPAVPQLLGLTLVVLEPVTMANLRRLQRGPKPRTPSGPKKFRWMRIAR